MDALEYEFWIRYLELKEAFLKADEVSLEERSFYITAYYSPLPGQIAYTTGSYNAEIRLNGSGKWTASWKDVFMGLLAAPRNYPFGTKIYLEWIWVGEVWDRWGAIVNSGERWHEYDRLDIWVWYGDEWRIRAKNWGTRVIKWKVLDGDYGITIEFDESPVAKYANLKVDASAPNEDSVKKLQNLFTDIGLYSGGITGNFADVKSSLIDYQLQKWIIVSRNDPEAWYFWTKTFAALNKDYWVSSWWLFIEKYLIPQSNLILWDFAKESVVLAKQKVDELLYKMYNGNSNKINSAKVQLKTIIGSYADKLDDIQRREELKYLVEIM